MKLGRFIVSGVVVFVVSASLALANPAMLPKHPGYPSKQEVSPVTGQPLTNDPGQTNAGGDKALRDVAGFDDARSVQQLTDPNNQRILKKEGAGLLPKVDGPVIKIEPPVKEATAEVAGATVPAAVSGALVFAARLARQEIRLAVNQPIRRRVDAKRSSKRDGVFDPRPEEGVVGRDLASGEHPQRDLRTVTVERPAQWPPAAQALDHDAIARAGAGALDVGAIDPRMTRSQPLLASRGYRDAWN